MVKLAKLLSEDYKSDQKYLKIAESFADNIIKFLKNDIKNCEGEIQSSCLIYDITDLYRNTVPFHDDKKCLIIFKDHNFGAAFSYGLSKDVHSFIFSIFDYSLDDYYRKFINYNQRSLAKLIDEHPNVDKYELAEKAFKKWLIKKYSNKFISRCERDPASIIHECIHLFDSIRHKNPSKWSASYPEDANFASDAYFNHPLERNAWYQQTVSYFDRWFKLVNSNSDKLSRYDNFKEFIKDFVNCSGGSFKHLTDDAKRRFINRAYALYQREYNRQKYQDFKILDKIKI